MSLLRTLTKPVRDFFNGVSEDTFATAGALAFVGAEKGIAALNNGVSLSKLDEQRKALLRADFGHLVDDIDIKYGAQMFEFEILGKHVGANPAGQTFGERIYLEANYRAGDAGQLELLAHELVHCRQYRRAGSSYAFGERYFREYYRSGFDYADNKMEQEANEFASCFMHRVDSSVQYANRWTSNWPGGWTSLVPFRIGSEVYVQRYSETSGAAQIVRVRQSADGIDETWAGDWTEGWSSFAPFVLNGAPHCLSYKKSGGRVHVYRFNPGGDGFTACDELGDVEWSPGWSSIMPFALSGVPHYLAYKAQTGRVSIGRLEKTGENGVTVTPVWSDVWTRGWTSFHPFVHNDRPHFLCYKVEGGAAAIDVIDAGGRGTTTLWRRDWSDGWTIFLPLSSSGRDFLAYKGERTVHTAVGPIPVPGTGRGHVARIAAPAEGTNTRWCKQWRGSWKCAASFPLNNVFHTIFYGADGDDVSISRFEP